jgi:hypothetical protein
MDRGGWKKVVRSPPQQERQIDIWSCGLFVLMALRCFASGLNYEVGCANTVKETMRAACLRALMTIPYVSWHPARIKTD